MNLWDSNTAFVPDCQINSIIKRIGMKFLKVFTLFLCISLVSCISHAQQRFIVKGTLSDTSLEGSRINFTYFNGTKTIRDTALVTKGSFEITGAIVEPLKATLSIKLKPNPAENIIFPATDYQEFYLDRGENIVNGVNLSTATITNNGISQKEFTKLTHLTTPYTNEKQAVTAVNYSAQRDKDSVLMKQYSLQIERLAATIDSIERNFIQLHPDSYVALHLLKDKASPTKLAHSYDNVKKLFDNFTPQKQQTETGKNLREKLITTEKFAIGKPSADFTMNDTLGKPVSLSSFRGKYVLLDFWASWCMPCRFENVTVVKAHDQFKDKNFTVLSVSLDKPSAKKAWLDAIKKDKLNWTNVAELQSDKNAVAELYGVYSIPMNFLIDPNGVIVAVHLRGEALIHKLEELLGR